MRTFALIAILAAFIYMIIRYIDAIIYLVSYTLKYLLIQDSFLLVVVFLMFALAILTAMRSK